MPTITRVGISSLSNSDGSLTLSPRVGDMVISINTGHANTWTAQQAISQGVITTSTPAINITQTWNNAAVTFDAPLFMNITNSASHSGSLLADFQVGGNTVVGVQAANRSSYSNTTLFVGTTGFGIGTNSVNALTLISAGNIVLGLDNSNNVTAQSNGTFCFSSGNPIQNNTDSGLSRLGPASLAFGNGTAGDFSGSLKLTTLTIPSGGTISIGQPTAGTGSSGTLQITNDTSGNLRPGLKSTGNGTAIATYGNGGLSNNASMYSDGILANCVTIGLTSVSPLNFSTSYALQVIGGTTLSSLFQNNSIGVTSTDCIVLQNATAATNGVPVQYAPRQHWQSHVWNTTSVAADNVADFICEMQPVSGTSPTANLVWSSRISAAGSGAFTQVLSLDSAGNITMATNAGLNGGFIAIPSGQSYSWASGPAIRQTTGVIKFRDNSNSNDASITAGTGTFSGQVICTAATTGFQAASGAYFYWSGRSSIKSTSDGVIAFRNDADNADSAITAAGITSSGTTGVTVTQGIIASAAPASALTVTTGAHTNLTASSNFIAGLYDSLTNQPQWATGTIASLTPWVFKGMKPTFVGASTVTAYSTLDINSAGDATGTNCTAITNNYFLTCGGTASPLFSVSKTGVISGGNTSSCTFTNPQAGGVAHTNEAFGAGAFVLASQSNSVSIGNAASCSSSSFVLIGANATSNQNGGVGIGANVNMAFSASSVCIGSSASVSLTASCIVLGAAATSTAANQFVAGSSANPTTNVYFGQGATNGTPTAYTINGTGGNQATNNIVGGNLLLAGGISTGNAVPGWCSVQAGALGGTSGKVVQTLVDRLITGPTKVLTNNTAIAIVNATEVSGSMIGGRIIYTVEVTDGTDFQVYSGTYIYNGTNKAGSFSNTITLQGTEVQNKTSGTLAITFAISAANPAVISVNANSSLVPSTGYPRITYSLENLGQQSVVIQ